MAELKDTGGWKAERFVICSSKWEKAASQARTGSCAGGQVTTSWNSRRQFMYDKQGEVREVLWAPENWVFFVSTSIYIVVS